MARLLRNKALDPCRELSQRTRRSRSFSYARNLLYPICQLLNVVGQIDLDDIHISVEPESAGGLFNTERDGPRVVREPLFAPDSVKNDAEVPFGQSRSQKQKMTLAEYFRQLQGQTTRDIRERERVEAW